MKREMEAYIVLLHLVSQGWAKFSDMRDLLGWESYRQGHGQNVIAYINNRLPKLSGEWGEEIPHINACMFRRNGTCSDYIRENVFGCDEGQQPSPLQIAEYAKKIANYSNWDKVLEVFRGRLFKGVLKTMTGKFVLSFPVIDRF